MDFNKMSVRPGIPMSPRPQTAPASPRLGAPGAQTPTRRLGMITPRLAPAVGQQQKTPGKGRCLNYDEFAGTYPSRPSPILSIAWFFLLSPI